MVYVETSLATVFISPEVAIEDRAAWLIKHGVDFQPLEMDTGESNLPVIYLLAASWWNRQSDQDRRSLMERLQRPACALVLTGKPGDGIPFDVESSGLPIAWIDTPISVPALRSAVQSGLQTIKLRLELSAARQELERRTVEMEEMHRVGVALSAEKNLNTLQEMVLRTSRQVTSADAGTLYLVEEGQNKEKLLVFANAQNDSINAPYQRMAIPLDRKSISGYVACTGHTLRLDDVYRLPPNVEYTFNPYVDNTFGYRTKSILGVPMVNHEGTTVGAIVLFNRKKHFDRVLTLENVHEEVEPFTEENEQVLSSFASQAAVALENKLLLDNIQTLFAGFIKASVTAIEARDPTTFGHSGRVASLTVGMARTVNEVQAGRWREVHFSEEQLKELEYAGLLHDFGKVGVREHVLVKPKKLYDWKLQELRSRFRMARQLIENQYLQRRLDYVLAEGRENYAARESIFDQACQKEMADLDAALQVVLQANEPSVLEEERFNALMQVAAQTVMTPEGQTIPLVTDEEMHSLSIRRGTLDEEERLEIESHVTHSFNFLIQIPWTKDLQSIPNIAYAHHEKLNGTGYPRKLRSDEIPIQARMMTIADIFDALTASDRPYKPAVPLERALTILGYEAKDGAIDAELLDLFIAREVYGLVLPGTQSMQGAVARSAG